MATKLLSILLLMFVSQMSFADSSLEKNEHNIKSYIEKIDTVNYLPNLLPIIFKNSDFIGLTEDQLAHLEEWRAENREPMIAAMKEITKKRIELKEAALSPDISSANLIQQQNTIFRLHREVMEYKLSCREYIVNTFSQENWVSFFMVLADEGIGAPIPVNYAEK